MIARVEGVLCELSPTRVVVDVGGVGYELHIPLSTFTELPDLGKTVALHVYTHMREASLQLFGFFSRSERAAFELLLLANRVGPRLAQTILSGISPPELLSAIRSGEAAVLRAVPGIGSKMASRMLVELSDRTDPLAAVLAASGEATSESPAEARSADDTTRDEALSALTNLGYPLNHAERVLDSAADDTGPGASLEDLMRAALKRLLK